ncbi:Putative transposase of IS4/5 family, partial [Modestobacter sp. DSM 44400]
MSVSPACSCVSCPTHPRTTDSSMSCGFYPSSSMTDAQWAVLEPVLPPPASAAGRGGRPEKHSRRLILDA